MGRLRLGSAGAIRVAVATALALGALTAAALAAGVRPAGSEPAQLLRLGDLPLGFVNFELREEHGEAPICERLTEPEDTPPRMLRFVRRFHPRGCADAFGFSFEEQEGATTPVFVGSAVLAARSRAEADAAWAVAPEILGRLFGDRKLPRAKPAARIGSRTRAFHIETEFVDGPLPVSILVWRSGNTLATVIGFGGRFAATDRLVAGWAKRQQAHIAEPTPYTNAELFDGEVGLEDPAIPFPVHWLGREFSAGGVPADRLSESGYRGKPLPESDHQGVEEGPGAPLHIGYSHIRLDTWPAESWPLYAKSKTGRAITSWKCTQTRTVALPEGTATIYGGYNQDFAQCPKGPPRAFTAWVKFGGETVVVNPPFAADSVEIVNPYGSFAAMETIVGALRLRKPPAG